MRKRPLNKPPSLRRDARSLQAAGLRAWRRARPAEKVRFMKSLEPEFDRLKEAGATVPELAAFVVERFAQARDGTP